MSEYERKMQREEKTDKSEKEMREMKRERYGNSDSKTLWSIECSIKLGDVFDSIK